MIKISALNYSKIRYEGIIYMKIGYHANEEIDEIIKRKLKEEKDNGYFFWGYGGNLCHPLNQVKPFIERCTVLNIKPKLLMSLTRSKPKKIDSTFANEYSKDKKNWQPLPENISVTGSKYAFICRNLSKIDTEIDLNSYVVAVGDKKGKHLSEYIGRHVDKACAFLNEVKKDLTKRIVKIIYTADLIEPWSVFVE